MSGLRSEKMRTRTLKRDRIRAVSFFWFFFHRFFEKKPNKTVFKDKKELTLAANLIF